jgi:hypothetical protein
VQAEACATTNKGGMAMSPVKIKATVNTTLSQKQLQMLAEIGEACGTKSQAELMRHCVEETFRIMKEGNLRAAPHLRYSGLEQSQVKLLEFLKEQGGVAMYRDIYRYIRMPQDGMKALLGSLVAANAIVRIPAKTKKGRTVDAYRIV